MPGDGQGTTQTLHASAVAIQGNTLLIMGASGSGKSALTLQMLAHGADLVADDRVVVSNEGGELWATPPASIAGLIEARGVGILNAPYEPNARVVAAINLEKHEVDRLPEERFLRILGIDLPLYFRPETPALAASMVLLLRHGRNA